MAVTWLNNQIKQVISPGAGWLHQLFIASASAFEILLKKTRACADGASY
jgi:hypothetical protein